MIPSPNHTNDGNKASSRDFTVKTALNSLQHKQCSEICDSVNSLGLNGRIPKVHPVPLPRIQETDQNAGTSRDKELLKRKGKAILDDGDDEEEEYNQLAKKRVGIYPRSYHNSFHFLMAEEDNSGIDHEKSSMPGPDNNGRNAQPLLSNLKEISHDPSRAEVLLVSHTEVTSAYSRGLDKWNNHKKSTLAEVSVKENSMFATYGSPTKLTSTPRPVEGSHVNDVPLNNFIGRTDDRMTGNLTSYSPTCRLCSDDSLCSDSQGRTEVGITIGSEPVGKSRHGASHTSHKNASALVCCRSPYDLKYPKTQKGKELVLSNKEDSMSISNEREGSYESVESTNSRNSISTDKRQLSPDPQLSEVSKKIKGQGNEDSSSGSSVRKVSSFMNWISTMINGYKRSELVTPLSCIPHPSTDAQRGISSFPASTTDPQRPVGFKSFFQSMYMSSFKTQNSSSNEHRASSEELDHGSLPMECDNVKPNFCAVIPTSSESTKINLKEHASGESLKLVCEGKSHTLPNQVSTLSEMHNQEICPLTTVDIPFENSAVNEKPRCSIKILPEPPEKDMPVSVPKNSVDTMANRSSFLENLWIQRLLPKVSSAKAGTEQCNQDMESAKVKLTNNCRMFDPSYVCSNKEQNDSVNHQFPSLEGPGPVTKNEKQDHSLSLIDPFSSKTTTDQKFKSNLNPILSSQRFKGSEPMASVFAKRLDAFRHIRPSTISSDATYSTNVCFYCGRTGHSIQTCSELDETELEYLLKNMNSYKGTVEASHLCIRCFQFNHWAAFCPLASSQGKICTDNVYLTVDQNCKRINNETGNHNFDFDEGALLWSGGEKKRNRDKVLVNPNATGGNGKAIDSNNLCLNAVKRQKPTSSSSDENESKGNQKIPNCHLTSTEETDYSVAIFEIIRKLRLSRTDITRWMKSPVPHSSLEGFFLRLRLGKRGEVPGGTGYQVACINGINGDNSVSADVGGFTYSVDSHCVSNKDFAEDELNAWWLTTLKGSSKPPSIEELNEKLRDRMAFGF